VHICGGPGRRVLLLETGIGPERMEAALTWLLRQPLSGGRVYRPRFVVSAGFSGALQEGIRVGDVVVATEVADTEGGRWPATWPSPDYPWPGRRGRVLTVRRLVGDPEEKRALGREHAATAVDMEAAAAARVCALSSIPFGCIRAISDDVHTRLSPRLVSLLFAGRVSAPRVLAALARSPRLAGELWRLARQTRLAARQLAVALGELLDGPGGTRAPASGA
jgi:adenosylhomocysteine nucleosidase